MNLSTNGLALLKKLEGFSANAYLDSAGIPTIGYGHVIRPRPTSLRITISERLATDFLLQDVAQAERIVSHVPFVTQPTQNQFDALVLFVFNIGVYNFNKSTMRKILIGKKPGNAAEQFDKWVYVTVNGEKQVVQGLVNRRRAERELFES